MNGIINLYKEAGMTSHDCVFKLRRILGTKKIGHGGTLDPDVEGVLPIAVGKATKVLEFMTEAGKVYEGQVTLGFTTETEDASGEIVEKTPVTKKLDEKLVDATMQEFVGPIIQIPPMYSAVKVNGRKLYEYARAGQEVERPQREVTIYDFERTSPITYEDNLARFDFRVACSKGTYVRTLAVDLAAKLSYAGHMSSLKRSASAGLQIEQAHKLSEVANFKDEGRIDEILMPMEYGVADMVRLDLSDEQFERVKVGKFLEVSEIPSQALETQELLATFYQDKLVAIYMPHPTKKESYKPKKVLIEN
ncbi:tRNA pseudouridine(55) synthase TruB [Floricoccus penangensis]|uniref:tRNA pseudouridine synthase B n=1 Tax=Floricoccus penangensis TaxID=1859475 RepID=A0A9Q5JEI1_9LACT|nr:tRNA pseudouridine(55) synthase TruB [Floricoccus penangensis]OFI45817.1 tRNA pseudouridine(55) synthase TruB [Floricoccus penangensis]